MSVAAVEHEHRVTPRELFFDLVFVFAFTQVATLLTDDPTFAGIGRGVLVLAALWWAWAAYAWLTNIVDPEESVIGLALLVALIAMFVAALVVPEVFGDQGVLFGAAFFIVCAMHLALNALVARGNRDLLGAVLAWRRGRCSAPHSSSSPASPTVRAPGSGSPRLRAPTSAACSAARQAGWCTPRISPSAMASC